MIKITKDFNQSSHNLNISDYFGFNVMHVAMRYGNVIDLKMYASHKN